MEETWYRPLSDWCSAQDIALCGHPAHGDEIGAQRFFHIPGQDLVWRCVEPAKPSSIEGPESTQGKGSSSAMIHLGRRRNSNEFCGAYGPHTTFEEFKWLADWCLVRGVNLLIPHAFYYSVRGPRKDERPPQVGPHSPWWDRFKPFADHCRRLCWVNTDSTHVCDIAILTGPDHCPWEAAKVCLEWQRDFNYLEYATLLDANVTEDGVRAGEMHYRALIVDQAERLPDAIMQKLQPLIRSCRVLAWKGACDVPGAPQASDETSLVDWLNRNTMPGVVVAAAARALRIRHVLKEGLHFYILFNEGLEDISTQITPSISGEMTWLDTETADDYAAPSPLRLGLKKFEVKLLRIAPLFSAFRQPAAAVR